MPEKENDIHKQIQAKVEHYDTRYRMVEHRMGLFEELLEGTGSFADLLRTAYQLGISQGKQIEEGYWILALNSTEYLAEEETLDIWNKRDQVAHDSREQTRRIIDENPNPLT